LALLTLRQFLAAIKLMLLAITRPELVFQDVLMAAGSAGLMDAASNTGLLSADRAGPAAHSNNIAAAIRFIRDSF
jgi:hypothetical protein